MNITLDRLQVRNMNYLKQYPESQRTSYAIELRKKKRLSICAKKRQMSSTYPQIPLTSIPGILKAYNDILLTATQASEALQALKGLRNIFSMPILPSFDLIIQSQILSSVISFITPQSPIEILEECTWIVCNIASGPEEIVELLIQSGVIETSLDVLDLQYDNISENIIWMMGNIAGDSASHCQSVVDTQFLYRLYTEFNQLTEINYKVLSITLWTLANITKKLISLPIDRTNYILYILKLLHVELENEVLLDWVKALCGLTFKSDMHLQAIIEHGLLTSVLNLIGCELKPVQITAIRSVGNILAGDSGKTQILINLGVLDFLHPALKSSDQGVRKEAYWALSNITGGNAFQVGTVVDHPIVKDAIKGLDDINVEVRSEASWVISNIGVKGCYYHILSLADLGLLNYIKFSLKENNPTILKNTLRTLECVLAADKINKSELKKEVILSGCLEALEDLDLTSKENLSEQINKILSTYFN
jgi:Armadillo/beta-catenin-like repeat